MRKKFVSIKMHYHAVDQKEQVEERKKGTHLKKKKSNKERNNLQSAFARNIYHDEASNLLFIHYSGEQFS